MSVTTIDNIVNSKQPYLFTHNGAQVEVYLGEIGLTHILARHHQTYYLGGNANAQTFFTPSSTINDIILQLDNSISNFKLSTTSAQTSDLHSIFSGTSPAKNFEVLIGNQYYTFGIKSITNSNGIKSFSIRQFYPGRK